MTFLTLSNFSCAPWSFIPLFFLVLCSFQVNLPHFLIGLFVFLWFSPMNLGSFSNQWGQEKNPKTHENVCVFMCIQFLVQLEHQGIKQAPFILSVICLPFQSL